jgi:N-methylhydantoinase A
LVTVERGRDPREFVMFAFGGAGPVHACDLAEDLGVEEVVVPLHAGLFSAYGLLMGELARTFTSPIMELEPLLRERFRKLESTAAREMRAEGFRDYSLRRYFEGRYEGQSHELVLPFTADSSARRAFDARHRELYGYVLPERMEVVNIWVRAVVRMEAPKIISSKVPATTVESSVRNAWLGRRSELVKVLQRESLRPGAEGKGPCIIEEYDSTLVVNRSWKWEAERRGMRLTR